MNRKPLEKYCKIAVIVLGLFCVGFALFTVPLHSLGWGYVAVFAFSVIFAPRLSLMLPRSNFTFSFSDSIVFLTFLLYGPELAILTAFVETLANCIFLKRRGTVSGQWMAIFNASLASLISAISIGALYFFSRMGYATVTPSTTRDLVNIVLFLSLTQFFAASLFASFYQFLKSRDSIWGTWKKQTLSSSLTQFMGAGLAGVIFKLLQYADLMMIGIASIGLTLIYLSYRQSIGDINEAIAQVEDAEREKAELERERRQEAEKHADQLSFALMKEERANDALRKSERDFAHAALHDSLTGLANRKKLGDILRKLIAEYKTNPSTNFQVLFLDIRSFKDINDSLGHSIGDKVLMIAAKRFARTISSKDTVARIGGDEFAIILRDLDTTGKAQKIARKIYQNITLPFALSGNRINVDVNIGIASCDAEYDTPEQILRDADIAMHFAKEKNAGPAVFTKDMRARFLERVRFEMDLRHAIERNELSLVYQPIVALGDGRLNGFEVLLRWHHSEFGMIPPNKFIPIAEQSDLIQPLTLWVLNRACSQLAEWQTISPEYRDLTMSVNISGKHLSDDELIDDIENILEDTRLHARGLKLEITESTAMENPELTVNILNKLKNLGVQLSLDDFGTGYSSLSYLHRLPFDTLKIDRSFVYTVGEQGENSEILQTIISLAKNLKMRVIAEGIETDSQLAVLQNLGCDFGQGFLLAKPKPVQDTEKLLYQRTSLLPFSAPARYEPADNTSTDDRLPVF